MRRILLAVGTFLAVAAPLAASAVTVGPIKFEYSVNPGDVVSGNLYLENEQHDARTFYSSFQRFNELHGERVFTSEEIGLPTWIETSPSVTLEAGKSAQVPFTITVPKDAPPGGHFAVIWWSSGPPAGGSGQLSVLSRAGILVYLEVSGTILESASVNNLSVPQTFYFDSVPFDVSLSVKNNGNSYVKAAGNLDLKNIFGVTQATVQINPHGVDTLPQSAKSFTQKLNPPPIVFGPYRVVARITYGANDDKVAMGTTWIWILPWPILIGVIIFLLIVFIGLPKGIRRYNRWIIKKASSRGWS